VDGRSNFNRTKGFMDISLFKKIIEQAYKLTHSINFSYFGEHTLHPHFNEIMSILSHRPSEMQVRIFTNFLMVKKEHMNSMIAAKVNNINISMDASTSETYDKVRRGNTCVDIDGKLWNKDRFDKLTEKVEYWFRRKDHFATRHEFVVSQHNSFEEKPFIDKWIPFLSSGDSIVTKDMLTYGGSIMLDKTWNKPNTCNACNMFDQNVFMVIAWDGKVGPCYLDTNMNLCIGSADETPLKEIMNSRRYIEVRDLSKLRLVYPCKTCDFENRVRTKILK
jgi:radical SAM protein with 4Fe4S-binding SPASM domain